MAFVRSNNGLKESSFLIVLHQNTEASHLLFFMVTGAVFIVEITILQSVNFALAVESGPAHYLKLASLRLVLLSMSGGPV